MHGTLLCMGQPTYDALSLKDGLPHFSTLGYTSSHVLTQRCANVPAFRCTRCSIVGRYRITVFLCVSDIYANWPFLGFMQILFMLVTVHHKVAMSKTGSGVAEHSGYTVR